MSVWTNIEGTVEIHKKDKVSIRNAIYDVFTDELSLDVKTEDKVDHYRHTISCSICIDGQDFIERYKEFLEALKPVKGGLDLSCTIRLLG